MVFSQKHELEQVLIRKTAFTRAKIRVTAFSTVRNDTMKEAGRKVGPATPSHIEQCSMEMCFPLWETRRN